MRLGEIIQLHTADVRKEHGIMVFDVTTDSVDTAAANIKSLKTSTSQRRIPVHQALVDLGFLEFVERQRAVGNIRLFPDYERSQDDALV